MDLKEKTENKKRHPWELSRCQNILNLIKDNNLAVTYADIGAGDRYFSSKLVFLTNAKVFAVDKEYKNKESKADGVICLNDISRLKNNSIDYIIMMDVLEHIQDEDRFIKIILEKLKYNGQILITVPAMQFLFSPHDVFLKHYRRYSRKQLLSVLKRNQIIVEHSYYFYSILFFLRYISLLLDKIQKKKKEKNHGIGLWHYSENSFLTRALVLILNIDFNLNRLLSKINFRLPGLSVLAICRKSN